jgi:putative zinc finger protein
VTCHDARELFSALIDETLSREERADVYGHLATCADCRRELASVERTVALIRGATPVRAPAGFVDRVVAAARPTPWYVRAARASLLPWPVKLPLGAAAVLLLGGLALLMFRGTEEQQRAARHEPAPKVLADRGVTAERRPPDGPAATAPAAKRTEPAAPSPPARQNAPSTDRADSPRAREQDRAAGATAPPASSEAFQAPDVVARLATPEPDTAERALAALVARLAGAVTTRRIVGDARWVDVAIPGDRYADFTREVARLGDYRTESEPSTVPATVRIAVRLGS